MHALWPLAFPTGTAPQEWTRNPLPQEGDLSPKIPGLPEAFGRGPFALNIMDQVVVPETLAPGAYVLSWRWDAEQTKQVWSHCSDVQIIPKTIVEAPVPAVAGANAAPAAAPVASRVCTGRSVGLRVSECSSWIDLYDALEGDQWPASWKLGCASLRTDPCGCDDAWAKRIVCSATRDFAHITEIYLLDQSLHGEIPDSFLGLDHLVALSLVDTSISGSLPARMGEMTALEMIWLDHNPLLGGPVPSSLAMLPRLSVLELHRSNFTGVLPPLNYLNIADCTLNDLAFVCPLPHGAAACGAACR